MGVQMYTYVAALVILSGPKSSTKDKPLGLFVNYLLRTEQEDIQITLQILIGQVLLSLGGLGKFITGFFFPMNLR